VLALLLGVVDVKMAGPGQILRDFDGLAFHLMI
jgi:hypothetical protein